MGKTSTGLLLAAACSAAVLAAVTTRIATAAESATTRYPVTDQQRRTADHVAQAGVPLADLAANAPERYTIKSGDTLWDLASMYLTSPWRWPELWGMNQDQVKNPHLIYPGQILVLSRRDGRATLSFGEGSTADIDKLSPRMREFDATAQALPPIPNHLIEPFLSQPLVLEARAFDAAPRIVATQEGRVFLGRGEKAYARGIPADAAPISYNVYRPLRPLYGPKDPNRRKPIAYEAFFLGTAHVAKTGDVSTLAIDSAKQEIGVGDRLVPIERQAIASYVPSIPAQPVDANVISIYNGVRYAGGGDIVTLNAGSNAGLRAGNVLEVLRTGATMRDSTARGEKIKLPDESLGYVFVFRVFDNIAYALIVRGQRDVEVGDHLVSPELTLDDIAAPRRR
ncbi:MAG: LysM peptidoglycan-binding domain-containing protein [Burkholderiaceae bacterium]